VSSAVVVISCMGCAVLLSSGRQKYTLRSGCGARPATDPGIALTGTTATAAG
jgi:hypothetical protein